MMDVHTEGELSEVAICQRIGAVLHRQYPGYPWMVGIHEVAAGVVVIDLSAEFKPPSLRRWAYLLHLANADDDQQVMRAGGEWLERLGLARRAAQEWAAQRAREHGIDLGNAVLKSNH